MLKLVTALVISTMIFLGANAGTQPASSPEPTQPITVTAQDDCWTENFGTDTNPEWVSVSASTPDGLCATTTSMDSCDPDTTCEGVEAAVEYSGPETVTSTCEPNTIAGAGGWTCTEDGIPADHECVVHISAQPYRAIVVDDTSLLCDVNATSYIQGEA